jgi:hypothetical protein
MSEEPEDEAEEGAPTKRAKKDWNTLGKSMHKTAISCI